MRETKQDRQKRLARERQRKSPTGSHNLISGDPEFWFNTSLKVDNRDRLNSPEFLKKLQELAK